MAWVTIDKSGGTFYPRARTTTDRWQTMEKNKVPLVLGR